MYFFWWNNVLDHRGVLQKSKLTTIRPLPSRLPEAGGIVILAVMRVGEATRPEYRILRCRHVENTPNPVIKNKTERKLDSKIY